MRSSKRTKASIPWLYTVLMAGAAWALLAPTVTAQQAPTGRTAASTPQGGRTPAAKKSHEASEVERAFAENCSRCHTAPDGFPPRISGTVVRHMRVRASLSERDEQALLRFFNPQ